MSIKPLRDFVVVSKEEQDNKTKSGLFMAISEEKIITGTVLAIGSGKLSFDGKILPLEVAVGDKVAFNKNLVTEMKDDGVTVYVLREDQLLCKL